MPKRFITAVILLWSGIGLSGCASYTTPGGPVDLTGIQSADIRELMAREPAAVFPAALSFARVQSPAYRSMTAETYGSGAFAIVSNREFMDDAVLDDIASWPSVRAIAPLTRLLIPSQLDDIDDLRTASARLKSDILIVFTLDTTFRVDGKSIGPLSIISLGLMRDRETVVSTTASAVFVDVRSGFVHGVAESTATETQVTSAWGNINVVDQARLITERQAFDAMLRELETTWAGIVAEHAKPD